MADANEEGGFRTIQGSTLSIGNRPKSADAPPPEYTARQDEPRCGAGTDDQPCPYRPIHKCDACGMLICLEHTTDFVANNTGDRWHKYDGHYCPECIEQCYLAYNEEVQAANRELQNERNKQRACDCLGCLGDSTCNCLDSLCKSI